MADNRNTVVNAFETLLAMITTANSYNTNAGENVFQQFRTPDQVPEDEFPCFHFLNVNEVVGFYATGQRESRLTISLLGYIKSTEDETLKTDTNKLADDIVTALISSQDLGDATVDYPDEINVDTSIIEPYGYIGVDVTYIFERNT